MRKLSYIISLIILVQFVVAPNIFAAKKGGTLSVAIRNVDYDTFDPHVSAFTQAAYVFRNVFDRLVYLDEEANTIPWLATSWKANKNVTEWTLNLREGVTFSDGSPLNAEVIVFNFDRMKNPATGSKQSGPLLGKYNRAEVVDELTVKVYFDEPYALFPFALSSPFMGIVSKTAVQKYGDKFNEHLVGSGPMIFENEIPNVEVTLRKNPNYFWSPTNLHAGPAYVNKLVFKFILEDETRHATLRVGETQIIDEIPPAKVDSMKADPNFHVLGAPKVGMARGIHFNIDHPPTDDKRVRMAFLHAIDRNEIDKAVFKGVYPVSYQVLTRGVRFYDSSLEDMYEFDKEKAKSLLDRAGWSKINSDGYRTKNGKVLSLFHATFPGYVAEVPAEVLQAQLKRVGIKFDINVMSGTAMMDGMTNLKSTFNTALVGTYSPDPGLFLKKLYHSSAMGSFNFSHYTTPELDKLLEGGLATANSDERSAIYKKIQKIIMDAAIVGGLYANASIFGTSKKVEGFKFDPYAQPEFFDVWIK